MKNFIKKMASGTKRRFAVIMAASAIAVSTVSPVFAAGGTADTATVDSMKTSFGDIVATGLLAIAGLAVTALTLFGAMYAWKLGKKAFSMIAR